MGKEEEQITRVRLPESEDEIFGIVEEALGNEKFRVVCSDGKVRVCRLIGKLRKRVWISVGDLILVRKWKIQGDKRGDIIDRYTPTEHSWLKKHGYIKNL